ncbi:Hypothetical predicted protein [Mytilus galloprovincialis]|uniref:Uncharacterized protein n=1 Tax=Mytilus galloprovincialis TaxID=29158 RepID=A0A8B6DXN3_MYTGA|nr:Hypothetical predicted protein [Mytilus galloprovincialis]
MTCEECQHLSKGSKRLSMYLNESGKSLPIVKLFQNSTRRHNEINEIISGVIGEYKPAIVGSYAEGFEDLDSDLDVMIFVPNFEVVDYKIEPFKINSVHCHTIPQPDERHPGYSKLGVISLDFRLFKESRDRYIYKDVKDSKNYLKNNVKECFHYTSDLPIDISIHGPAYSCIPTENLEKTALEIAPFDQVNDPKHFDFVSGISSKQWPAEAAEWKTRKRTSNWPTKKLVEHIINTGYVLAGVGSKESKESELQWRVSFNEAEQLMIESLNETQMHCLFLLKLLKRICLLNIAGKNITSYTMKTVMFLCLEEKSVGFWQPSNLVNCFYFCVSKLKSFVDRGFLPNYFIPKRNQFVANEFTSDIQTKTKEYLEGFLKNQKDGISLILPSYKENTDIICSPYICQLNFIQKWLKNQLFTAYSYSVGHTLFKLYDGYNIPHIYERCNKTLDKLTTVRYRQPLIKKVQNFMGVLQYLLHREEKDRVDSDSRKKYSEYMKLSASGDLTHNPLRIATCYLDDGVKEDCLNIIRRVTDSDGQLYKQTHRQRLQQTLHRDIEALFNKSNTVYENILYTTIINDIDLVHQDPYRTTHEFEKLKDKGHVFYGYDTLILAWKECYFDVTFMPAELPVLPKPAALELCIDNSQKHISFHPFLYALLLEFLWHEKYGSVNRKKESVLEKFENYVSTASVIPDEQKSVGLNFMAYCYSLQKDNQLASRCLVRSLRLNPIRKNVAYWYMWYKKYRIKKKS